jgi:hypothetical protein
MKMLNNYLFFMLSILSILSCQSRKLINSLDQLKKSTQNNIIYLKSGQFVIESSIVIPSGTVLVGNNTTLLVKKGSKLPVMIMNGVKDVVLRNIHIRGEELDNSIINPIREKYNTTYFLLINQCDNLLLDNCTFQNSYGTVVQIQDCKNINVTKCTFENIGVSTPANVNYSYDGIFIGSYIKTENINIKNCIFKNIGNKFPAGNPPWPNDGDGVHIQGMGVVENIVISNCQFTGCATRAVKIQSGDNISIKNNRFTDCYCGVTMAIIRKITDIRILDNIVKGCTLPFGSNSNSDAVWCDKVVVAGNKVDKCDHFFRTSGVSGISNSRFDSNQIEDIGTFFLSGRYVNTVVKNNTITTFGTAGDKSYFMALEILEESDNLIIEGNTFGKHLPSNTEMQNFSKKRVEMRNNRFTEPPSTTQKKKD